MRRESLDVVVIGSGIGGLAAARMLAEFGHKRVLVLEQHYTLGGTTHEFTRDARFHFATGVHCLGTAVEGGSPQAMLDYLPIGSFNGSNCRMNSMPFICRGSNSAYQGVKRNTSPNRSSDGRRRRRPSGYFKNTRKASRGRAFRGLVNGLPVPVQAAGRWLASKLFRPPRHISTLPTIARRTRAPPHIALWPPKPWGGSFVKLTETALYVR